MNRVMNIGEAAEAAGVSTKMIRHDEQIGLVPAAARTDAGYRQYFERDVSVLRFIRQARRLGFSIEQIAELLGLWSDAHRASRSVKAVAQQHVADLEQKSGVDRAGRAAQVGDGAQVVGLEATHAADAGTDGGPRRPDGLDPPAASAPRRALTRCEATQGAGILGCLTPADCRPAMGRAAGLLSGSARSRHRAGPRCRPWWPAPGTGCSRPR